MQALVDADGLFDLVLLDVPCGNSGVLARRPEARHRFTRESADALVVLQRKIIAQGAGWLVQTPGAALVYATCSLDPRENDEQAAWAAAAFGLTSRERPVTIIPIADPPTAHRDGAFVAVLTR